MAAKVEDISGLPYWPRMLSREQAAAYVGVSVPTFELEVSQGIWPQPIRRGMDGSKRPRVTWDRVALDRAIDNGDLPEAPAKMEDDYEERERAWKAQRAQAQPRSAR
jgi:hypothetical protein